MVNSLIDIEYSKLREMQIAFLKFNNVNITYKFQNNNKSIQIQKYIKQDVLDALIHNLQILEFTSDDINYISTLGFDDTFIEYLKTYKLPNISAISDINTGLDITINGLYHETILWKCLLETSITELYYHLKYQNPAKFISHGTAKNFELITFLSKNKDIQIIDNGYKYRFSSAWHYDIIKLSNIYGNMLGTTSIQAAMDNNMTPISLMDDDMFMIMYGVYNELGCDSWEMAANEWFGCTNEPYILNIDTYNIEHALGDFGYTNKKSANGYVLNGDSGLNINDTIDTVLNDYSNDEINTNEKILVIRDRNLSIDDILCIESRQLNISTVFAMGDKLTNNTDIEQLDIDVLPYEVVSIGDDNIVNIKLSRRKNNFGDFINIKNDFNA